MKLTIEPTEQFFMAGEVMVRLWTGTDEDGLPLFALVAGVGTSDGAPAVFDGLVEIPPPGREEAAAWARKIMLTGAASDEDP